MSDETETPGLVEVTPELLNGLREILKDPRHPAQYRKPWFEEADKLWDGSILTHRITCEACPLQIEGKYAAGPFFYFRARHDTWTLEIGPTQEEAVCGELIAEGEPEESVDASWMDPREAVRIIVREGRRLKS